MAQEIISRQEAIDLGLGRYFTGEACKHGHVAERVTLNSTCTVCMRVATKKNRDDAVKRMAAARERTAGESK